MEISAHKEAQLRLTPKEQEEWFGAFIHEIKTHQLLLESNTASNELKKFYDTLMSGDEYKMVGLMKEAFMSKITKIAVLDFLKELKVKNKFPIKLAFDFSGLNLSVWAIINNDDEEVEDALIMAEAKVNATFFKYGFHVSSIILEESDKIDLPPHYIVY